MQCQPDNIYLLPQMQALLAYELAYLGPMFSEIYGQCGLVISSSARSLSIPSHPLLPKMIELELSGKQIFSGEVIGTPALLPFVSESFSVVLVQHAGELVADLDHFISELIRVLAPEGTLLIMGINPYSCWHPWLRWKMHKYPFQSRFQSPRQWRASLAREHVETLRVRYFGSFFPRLKIPHEMILNRGWFPLRFFSGLRGGYLLCARKRRATLTPMKLTGQLRKTTLQPGLASSASRNDV